MPFSVLLKDFFNDSPTVYKVKIKLLTYPNLPYWFSTLTAQLTSYFISLTLHLY